MIVAIDGPAGAGKSTVARAVAERLGFAHLDTGAMYRALTLGVLEQEVELEDPSRIEEIAGRIEDIAGSIQLRLDDGTVWLGERDVTTRLRDPDVTAAVSRVSAAPLVRASLVPVQRKFATAGDIVVEGRDIGTVVFPDAEVKVYLTADPDERALRRARQLGLPEDPHVVAGMKDEIGSRDHADASRPHSPLSPAGGSHRIDSTSMTIAEVVDEIVTLVAHTARAAER